VAFGRGQPLIFAIAAVLSLAPLVVMLTMRSRPVRTPA